MRVQGVRKKPSKVTAKKKKRGAAVSQAQYLVRFSLDEAAALQAEAYEANMSVASVIRAHCGLPPLERGGLREGGFGRPVKKAKKKKAKQ